MTPTARRLFRAVNDRDLQQFARVLDEDPDALRETLETTLLRGADVLAIAVDHAHEDLVEACLAAGIHPDERKPGVAHPPINWAVDRQSVGIVRRLIAAGADLAGRGSGEETPLLRCVRTPSHPMLFLLLGSLAHETAQTISAGAKTSPHPQINACNDAGDTALHLAARRGDGPMVDALLAAGALVNARNRHGNTALYGAAADGDNPQPVCALLAAGADPHARNRVDETPLLYACRQGAGNLPIIESLLAAGSNPSARDHIGFSPLHHAARHGQLCVVEHLLAAGADPTRRSSDTTSPLQIAESNGYTEIAERLRAHCRARRLQPEHPPLRPPEIPSEPSL